MFNKVTENGTASQVEGKVKEEGEALEGTKVVGVTQEVTEETAHNKLMIDR